MDPPALMNVNENSFHSANTNAVSYNLSEIWPFPINGGGSGGEPRLSGGADAGGLELRRAPFGSANLGQLIETANSSREVSGNDYFGGGVRKRRELEEEEAAIGVSISGGNVVSEESKRLRSSGPKHENQISKADAEVGTGKGTEQNSKSPPDPPKDYIHVRARRGQATDSHSLAERARREKISERMKILQDIVPGCNKVIGKALVLDEIINYIQSLQRQVEFLSMKLEAINSRMNLGMDGYPPKDHFGPQAFDASGVAYSSQPPREYSRGSSPDWLHMQVGGGFDRHT